MGEFPGTFGSEKKKSLELLMLDHLPRVNICIYTVLYTYIKVFQYVNEIK